MFCSFSAQRVRLSTRMTARKKRAFYHKNSKRPHITVQPIPRSLGSVSPYHQSGRFPGSRLSVRRRLPNPKVSDISAAHSPNTVTRSYRIHTCFPFTSLRSVTLWEHRMSFTMLLLFRIYHKCASVAIVSREYGYYFFGIARSISP